MPSKFPEPSPVDTVHTKRALATVEAFLQASSCPDHTKNAWLYLKNGLKTLSAPQSFSANPVEKEILQKLSDIEKQLSSTAAALQKPLSYADQARLAPPPAVHEKAVPSRALREVTVKIVGDPEPSQTSVRLVESINAARSTKTGKVIAAQKLQSCDIVITADNAKTKNLIEQEEGRTKVIAEKN
jgi:hypothetical protein